ncbi:type II toxin-antitoxin system RelE/ParE family toxin [Bdellovibrionota bacterium FG-1]
MKVVWTEPARDRLVEIEDFIAQDSPDRAVSFVLELIEQADKLVDFPDSGRFVPEDEKQVARELIYEGYRIIYCVRERSVYVLSVFEGSRLFRPTDLK